MSKQRFFVCETCGNLVGMIHTSGVPLKCCGSSMKELEANTVDASTEKHIPVITVNGDLVTVEIGSVTHPMEEKHHIEWIYLETKKGGQRKAFHPGDLPSATFALHNDVVEAAYAYCNIHGLWKKEL